MDRKAVDAWFRVAARAAWSAGALAELAERAGVSRRQAARWLDGSRSVRPAVADRLGIFLVQHAARLQRLAAALPLGPESATARALSAVASARPEALELLDNLPAGDVDAGWSDPFTWPAGALDAEIARVAALPPLHAAPEAAAPAWAFNEPQDVAARAAAAPAPAAARPAPVLDLARIKRALEARGVTVASARADDRLPRGTPVRDMVIREEAARHAAGTLVYLDELPQFAHLLPENQGDSG